MKILITGKKGQLGRALSDQLCPAYKVTTSDRNDLDICNEKSVNEVIRTLTPDIIINAAAYTAVDLAETHASDCWAANAQGPLYLARAAAYTRAQLIHFSTDYVFDGQAKTPYSESSNAAPLSIYGHSKLEGDKGVLNSGAAAIVLRTGWLYSGHGPSFVQTILKKIVNGESLKVVDDQRGTPTSAEFLSHVVHCLIPHLPPVDNPSSRLLNVSCGGSASWFDFAARCQFVALEKWPDLNSVALNPISAVEYGSAAERPNNSCLSTSLLQKDFGITPPDWRGELDRVFSLIDL